MKNQITFRNNGGAWTKVEFPKKCIYCGEVDNIEQEIKLQRNVEGWLKKYKFKQKDNILVNKVKVPFCNKHSSENKMFKKVLNLSLYGGAILPLVIYLLLEGFEDFPVGLLLAVIFMFISRLIANIILKQLKPSFKDYPSAFKAKKGIACALGFKAEVNEKEDDRITFQILNDRYFEEFKKINSEEIFIKEVGKK